MHEGGDFRACILTGSAMVHANVHTACTTYLLQASPSCTSSSTLVPIFPVLSSSLQTKNVAAWCSPGGVRTQSRQFWIVLGTEEHVFVVCGVRCAVCGVQCAVCAVCGVRCALCAVCFNRKRLKCDDAKEG